MDRKLHIILSIRSYMGDDTALTVQIGELLDATMYAIVTVDGNKADIDLGYRSRKEATITALAIDKQTKIIQGE